MPHFLRLRFSLLTLLLLTTIAALGVAVWRLGAELIPLRQEVRRLRNEVGVLVVEDETKLHAIRVETKDDLHWKWRVWFPEGTTYAIRVVGGEGEAVPQESFPTGGGGTIFLNEPGEHVIQYLISRDPRDDSWWGKLITEYSSVGEDRQPWVKWKSTSRTTSGVTSKSRTFATDSVVELFRLRVTNRDEPGTIEEESTTGFLIWLEPQ